MTTPGDKTPQAEGATKGNVAPGSATPGNGPSGSTNQAGAPTGTPAAPGTPPGGTPPRATTTTDLPAPGGERDPGDSTWIYDQLGLSPEEYKGDPAPDAANLPSSAELRRRAAALNLDYDALRPGDPNESAFPPGSLGGGGIDPPTRKWEGFGAATAGLPAQAEPPAAAPPAPPAPSAPPAPPAPTTPPPAAATPAAPAVPKAPIKGARPVRPARSAQPSGEPFKDYDAKQATGDIQLPTHGQSAQPASRQPQSVRPAARNLPVSTEKLSADSLTADKVLKQRKKAASKGWRKGVMAATGGLVNLGPGSKERRSLEFEDRVRTEIPGCHRLAVISLKGGVGKTTTAAALGSVFASLRGDRVIAIDANPDRGTLGDKIVPGLAKSTVRDFVSRSAQLDRYSAVREFTAQAESRLEVLVSESDPLASLAFSENDYRIISDILERFYNLILTDCGTGLLHSAMVGVLAKADQVVIVSSASLDGARSASATLDWLEAHNYSDLARESVTVVTSVRPQAASVHLDEIIGHFAKRTRAVVAVPYDPHLAEGGQIDLSCLGKGAYQAYLELAAEIADQFPRLGLGKHG